VATEATDPDDIADAERRLGVRIPDSLRVLYGGGDGRYDDDGRWWVVWPIARVREENERYWREGLLDRSLLAFGDDGTGDPFCTCIDDAAGDIARWSMIDRSVSDRYASMDVFIAEWLP
jgi:hypothetical protein